MKLDVTRLEHAAMDATLAVLRRHGSPLVCVDSDGVFCCKDGVWGAHKTTLGEAIESLEMKIQERKAGAK